MCISLSLSLSLSLTFVHDMDGVVVKTPRGADVRDEDDTNGVATVDAVITAFVNQKQPIAAEAHVHRQTMFLRDALRGTTHTHTHTHTHTRERDGAKTMRTREGALHRKETVCVYMRRSRSDRLNQWYVYVYTGLL